MHVMFENNERYDCKTARWIIKKKKKKKTMQSMWILNRNDAWKKSGQTKILIAISIDWATGSIDRKSGKIRFLKNKAF